MDARRDSVWSWIPHGIESNTLRPSPIQSERHRAPRHQFTARIELTDMQSEKHISGHTKDLSLFGCFVETVTPFLEGTKVRLKMSRGETHLVAQGR